MESTRRWIHTISLAALAVAALIYTVNPADPAHAAAPRTAMCKEFIPPEGVSALSVNDNIRVWMNEQMASDRDEFMIVHRAPDNRAQVICAW